MISSFPAQRGLAPGRQAGRPSDVNSLSSRGLPMDAMRGVIALQLREDGTLRALLG